jgi:uncharacterized protein
VSRTTPTTKIWEPMDTAIGASLKASPRLLWGTVTAAVLIVGADMASVALGTPLEFDITFRFTLALIAVLFCAFISAAQPPSGGITFGFRVTPRQGWFYWIRMTAIFGVVLFVILFIAGLGFLTLGNSLPEPRLASSSQVWPYFLLMCITAPLSEEVVYRLLFCPPIAALLGVRYCIVLNGLIFAGLHFLYGNPSPENILGGFILSWAFLKSETLIIPISLHAGGNFCAFLSNVGYFYWWHGSVA